MKIVLKSIVSWRVRMWSTLSFGLVAANAMDMFEVKLDTHLLF